MPNKNYVRGYNFEMRVREWLLELGRCDRSPGSKGVDLTFLHKLRFWKVSCKKKRKNPSKFISDELEKHDCVVWGWDRSIPIIAMHLPKFVEMVGQAEAEDVDLLFNEDSAA